MLQVWSWRTAVLVVVLVVACVATVAVTLTADRRVARSLGYTPEQMRLRRSGGTALEELASLARRDRGETNPYVVGVVFAVLVGIGLMPVVFGVIVGGLYGDQDAGSALGARAAQTVMVSMMQVGLLAGFGVAVWRWVRNRLLPVLSARRAARRSAGAAHPVED